MTAVTPSSNCASPGDTGRLNRMFLLCGYRVYPDRLARDTETKGDGARDERT